MTGWIIAGSIIAVIILLLSVPVVVRFEYYDTIKLKISWLFFTFVKIPKTSGKKKSGQKNKEKAAAKEKDGNSDSESKKEKFKDKKDKKSDEKDEKSEEKPKEKDKKPSLTLEEIFGLVKVVWNSLSNPVKRLLKSGRIIGFYLNIVCGGSDAAKAAINFGRINMLAGNALAFLDGCFKLKKPDFNITCDFLSEKTRTECELTFKLTPMAAAAFLFRVLGRGIKGYMTSDEVKSAVSKLLAKS